MLVAGAIQRVASSEKLRIGLENGDAEAIDIALEMISISGMILFTCGLGISVNVIILWIAVKKLNTNEPERPI
jgi:hypothetical protein